MSQLQDNLKEIKRQKDKYLLPENLKTGINCLGVTGTLIPAKEDQTKTVNPSTSQQNIIPDYNKVLSRVTVNAVTSSIDNNIIASNIRNGVDILGVTGNFQGVGGEVKLFDTVEHMQADENPHINDMAVVYGTRQTDVTENSEFSSCIFPNTVVLDAAFSGNVYGSFATVSGSSGYFQGDVRITSSEFSFSGMGDVFVDITYTSEDGITYTRTDGGEELQEFESTIKWEDDREFNPVIGKFMKVDGVCFEGLYNYATYQDMYVLVTSQLNATSEDVYKRIFYGKNGVETGALQVVTNLSKEQALKRINIWNDYNNATFTLDSTIQDLTSMFLNCTSLTSIPLLDTSNVTSMNGMFSRCTSLTSIPLLDTSGVTNMSYMFNGCAYLTSIPSLDTSGVTNMSNMFNSCTNLSTIPLLNTSNVTNMDNVFYHCTNLDNTSLNNILLMCANSSVSNKTLKYIGLTPAQATTCQSLSNYSAFTAAGWTTGY